MYSQEEEARKEEEAKKAEEDEMHVKGGLKRKSQQKGSKKNLKDGDGKKKEGKGKEEEGQRKSVDFGISVG